MSDRYQQLVNTPIGKVVAKQVGLPNPLQLQRYEAGQPVISGPVLLGSPGGRLAGALTQILAAIDADVSTPMDEPLRGAAAQAGLDARIFNPEAATADERFKALVLDATGIQSSDQLEEAWAFLSPTIRRVMTSGRVIVLGTPPQDCPDPTASIAHRALEGLTRAIGKEVKKGATSQLTYVAPEAEDRLESTMRFFLSPKSAFVSGQVVHVGAAVVTGKVSDWRSPLNGKVALVTGAARGIGAAIAEVLARDGAHVVGFDVEPMADQLAEVAGRLGGSSLTADITDPDAPALIADHLLTEHGGVDIVVHNAGVTRDKNYSTSKAGVIGLVHASAPQLAKRGITINAVAPGFIETRMTAAMPIAIREAGRRMNSVSQGGLPIDVAETIAWFANPASGGITGNIVRVCGQSLLGA
jgi:3-oxoacyl-[acyl-carrier protein] reductase